MLNRIKRPVHKAVCLGKILCPTDCVAQIDSFYESGVVHQFRVKHKKEFSMSDRNESIRVSRQIQDWNTCMHRKDIEDIARRCKDLNFIFSWWKIFWDQVTLSAIAPANFPFVKRKGHQLRSGSSVKRSVSLFTVRHIRLIWTINYCIYAWTMQNINWARVRDIVNMAAENTNEREKKLCLKSPSGWNTFYQTVAVSI